LGTTYGGDGRTTFGLPDLRGRSIVHVGSGPGISTISWGEKSGRESVSLTTNNMPLHNHVVNVAVNTAGGEDSNPTRFIASHASAFSEEKSGSAHLGGVTVSNSGGSQDFNIRNPFLGVYMSIAMVGIYPSRS
jgi:microcystin-dependent protein